MGRVTLEGPLKLLLVDSDTNLLASMQYALQRLGYRVVIAADGQQALAVCQAEKPDLVVLDIDLPTVDGFEVCRRVRHESATPVILLTARDGADDVSRGRRVGAGDYIVKPFSPRQLAMRVQVALRGTSPTTDQR